MADAWQTYPVEFNGGLISNLSPLQQGLNAPGSATTLINFEPSIEGGYRRIQGFEKFGSSNAVAVDSATSVIRGIHRYDGDVIVARGTKLYASGTGTSWTTLSSSLGGSNKVRFAKYNFGTEKLIVVDGSNKPFTFDGTTFTALAKAGSSLTGADFVTVFKTTIFIGNGTKLIYSEPRADLDAQQKNGSISLLFDTARGSGEIDVGATITDLIVFRDQLVVFTTNKILRVSGSSISDFDIQPISDDLGAVEEDTAREIGGDVMFLAPDGLRLLSATDRIGDFGLAVVSKSIQKELLQVINASTTFASLVIRGKSQYRLFGFNTGYTDDAALGVLGTQFAGQGGQNMAWAELRGINAHVAYSEYENEEEFVYFANDDGFIYQLEKGDSFAGANVPASFRSPYLPLEDPRMRKTFYKAVVYTDPTGTVDFDFSLKLDFDRTNTGLVQPPAINLNATQSDLYFFDDPDVKFSDSLSEGQAGFAAFAGSANESIFETPVIGSGFTVAIDIQSDNTNPPFSLDATTIEYVTNSRR